MRDFLNIWGFVIFISTMVTGIAFVTFIVLDFIVNDAPPVVAIILGALLAITFLIALAVWAADKLKE